MIKDINQYFFSFDELNFNEEKLIEAFRDFSTQNVSLLKDTYHYLYPFLIENCKSVAGYKYIDAKHISFQKNILIIDNIEFNLGPIIYRDLKDVSDIFLFVCTVGNRLEEKVQELVSDGDTISAFILDRIASELVELTADLLELQIQNELEINNYNMTHRYSPGYCGWSVSEQQKLFSLLPKDFCGVHLTESSLMLPIKSVSGIYGAAFNLIRKDYHCEICDDEFCYRRKSD
ncbi:MAG: 5-methyltetrahydrofolate--homocysteine methyltransferase [Ignavibacterium sp.]|uniref:vitamin B12 dependent-methionine synthase activation domain-containing protein n=1 Tax=Ignavibacterium sp. TaxID=2651167 RepID=UPI0021DC74F7|nr:vitamin B12 dependent-methionine synthase activation domain-containing protein [Ignavibacterium sp.]BDQ02171.1 MAG: 5-methyltetrahydrofolate--homocysteine methyltransferase [Ignavibacterium sp.]GIV45700.1 MAG: 5-methyltetrahydrofolate--homocysteine methyltransferase [Ignavibacterium sp.]